MEDEFISKHDLVVIRDFNKDDSSFLFATWLQGLYYGNYYLREIDKDTFFKCYHAIIESILQQKDTFIAVSCLKEDEDVILGYAVCQPEILHWVFIKDAWRKLGLAKDLIPKDIKFVTHLTEVGANIKPREWKFNPFLI